MDVARGAAAVATAAGGDGRGSGGFVNSVVGYSSSPLLFWFLTVALVAAIHLASGYISPSSGSSRSEDGEAEKTTTRGGGFAGDEMGEAAAAGRDDRIMEMMRSFSIMHESEEGFMEVMATYGSVVDGRALEPAAPAEAPPRELSSLSFRFQDQIPKIPSETAVISGEIPVQEKEEHDLEVEKESSLPLESTAKLEHTYETEEAEELLEAEEHREVMEAAPKIVATTHNYRFLTERDFRGFVQQPAAMTVRVQESFAPSPSTSPAPAPAPAPAPPAQPDERRVVDVASHGGGFLTEHDFRPATEHRVRESVAPSPGRTLSGKPKPASSPPVEPKGASAVSGGRTSFASEFSGFDDSDSESSASDGYSVKELVVESDSDWFHSEKDFPAAAHHAGSLRSYRAKVLKAIDALDEAKLERSFQDSVTTVSPGSVGQASPESIGDGSVKYPEDMWSRSPSPDAEYKDDEEKEAEEVEEMRNIEDEEEEEASVDFSDDGERSSASKRMAVAPVYDADSAAENSLGHSEKETITIHDHSDHSEVEHSEKGTIIIHDHSDHSDDAVFDVWRSPEAVSQRESTVSSSQVAVHDAKRSLEPSENEFASMSDRSFEDVSTDRLEFPSTNDQSDAVVSGYKRSPEHLEREFASISDQSSEPISDVWNQIVGKHDKPDEMVCDDKRSPEASERQYVSKNYHSGELDSDDPKAIVTTDYQSSPTVSDDKNIPEPCKKSPQPTEEEHASANGHSDKSPRRVHFSVSEKAKALDEELEGQEDKWKDLTEEEEDELESLWEHQDLIEQLKLELKKVRSIGLPTILEESETPKAPMEDLKPWRIDTKFLREDPMDELNKFYKSYRERMRKFDILCYQKMYAIDFLQLRRPQQSTGSLKTLSPTVTSILSHNFRPSRRRSPEDPSERFLKELRYDLETVYVGQMCLSWEFLRWQYEQARDLPESDPYHSHHYNQVAGEFQQFQVVVQRFVEDESFKGPRLPNYINNRCVLRNLLQVPVIKEDSLKDRMEDQRKGNYVITSEELEDIMAESMHTFWEFIKADRVETVSVLKGLSNTHVELQDPLDHELMTHIQATLQKKEKRLKDHLRTGNCIVKKFKKPKEDRANQILFFSQVDMRLVARVLRMPRITSDQLQWCKAKLDKIILVDRKIHREPSFLLFPC